MAIIVLAETEKGARELCAGARTLDAQVTLITPGAAVTGVADKCLTISVPEGAQVEAIADTVIAYVAQAAPAAVLVEPTRRMKVVAGKLAAANGTSVITDAKAFNGASVENLYFGGVAVRTQKAVGLPICTAGAAPFGECEASGTDAVEELAFAGDAGAVKVRSCEALPPAGVDLTAAKRIVAAGRGFGAEEELGLARDLAAKIGGEVGCTRPLTESENWFPREAYIGVSGLMLSPDVYVGVGVSGQMQHMVGVNSAKVAFAINKDKNAPIFNQVDYGIVGDLKDVLPQVIAAL